MYQKLNRAKIKAAALERGYGEMNEEAQASSYPSEPVIQSAEEAEAAEQVALARINQFRKDRFKVCPMQKSLQTAVEFIQDMAIDNAGLVG
jgi:hypothetical protein